MSTHFRHLQIFADEMWNFSFHSFILKSDCDFCFIHRLRPTFSFIPGKCHRFHEFNCSPKEKSTQVISHELILRPARHLPTHIDKHICVRHAAVEIHQWLLHMTNHLNLHTPEPYTQQLLRCRMFCCCFCRRVQWKYSRITKRKSHSCISFAIPFDPLDKSEATTEIVRAVNGNSQAANSKAPWKGSRMSRYADEYRLCIWIKLNRAGTLHRLRSQWAQQKKPNAGKSGNKMRRFVSRLFGCLDHV